MSLFSALSVAMTGLNASTVQLQTTANNIANAGQAGYTRKSAVQSSSTVGDEGGGTQITGFTRVSNSALSATLNTAISTSSKLATQNEYLERVQTILGANYGDNPPLSKAMSDLASVWSQLEASPESIVLQNQVIQYASNLTAQVQSVTTAVESLDRQTYADVNATLSELNNLMQNVVSLNNNIASAYAAGVSYGDIQDQRDQVLQKIAGITDIIVMERPLGRVAIYTSTGYSLVDGETQSFSYNGTDVTSPLDPSLSLNDVLVGGKLEALVDFRADGSPSSASVEPANEVIRKLRSQLDGIVDSLTYATAGTPQSFANAYDSTASVAVQGDCIDFTCNFSGTFGNGITVTLGNGTAVGTYKATVSIPGQADEVFDNVAGSGAALWENLATAINAGSRLIAAEARGGDDAPVLTTLSLTGGDGEEINGNAFITLAGDAATLTALAAGSDGNSITVTIANGTNANSFKATISAPGMTTEVFDNIDASGGAAAFWTAFAEAINEGNASHVAPSAIIMATKGTGTSLPVAGATTTYRLADGSDELQNSFFVGTDRTTFAVNADLLNGTKTIKASSVKDASATFKDSSRTFSEDGINLTNVNYETMTTGILTSFQQASRNISQLCDTASAQQEYLTVRLSNETGVNVDDEVLLLMSLQNSYAASARVINVVNKMFDILEGII